MLKQSSCAYPLKKKCPVSKTMVKTKRELVFVTFLLSSAACIISFVSLFTEKWVVGTGRWTVAMPRDQPNTVKYGLFSGTFEQQTPQQGLFEITTTCLVGQNVCAMICGYTSEDRQRQLEDIFYNRSPKFNVNCPNIPLMWPYDGARGTPLAPPAPDGDSPAEHHQFINGAAWAATVLLLCVCTLMGALSAGLAVYNTAANPVAAHLSVFGLYIYNAVGLFAALLVIAVWGAMYTSTLIHNVAIFYTLVGKIDTDGQASLGYSYWINLLSAGLYATNICVLYVRQYLIAQEPKVNVHLEDDADPGIYLY